MSLVTRVSRMFAHPYSGHRLAPIVFAATALACTSVRPWPFLQTLPGASLLPVNAPHAFAVMEPGEGTAIGYSGELLPAGLDALKRADNPSVHTLLIRSAGGETMIGMAFGEWVHARGLDVVVVDLCLSSCANYVFTAGKKKTILPGALVSWHGDVHQKNLHAGRADLGREDAFFSTIGVNECLCRLYETELGGPTFFNLWGWAGFYTMSAEDMARFGVGNVEAASQREAGVNPVLWTWIRPRFVEVPRDMNVRTACR